MSVVFRPVQDACACPLQTRSTVSGISRRRAVLLLIILFVPLLLTACGGQPTKEQQKSAENMPEDPAERQLWLAQRAIATERADYLLAAAQLFADREDYERAVRVIESINTTTLSVPQYERFALTAGRIAMATDQPAMAADYFEEAPENAFTQSSLEDQLAAIQLHATALSASGNPLEAARLRVMNAGLFTGNDYWDNHNRIWANLRATPALDLSQALETATNYDWQGWLQLINQIRINQFSFEMQLQALQQWQQEWPAHVAAQHLPDELEMLSELPNTRPQKIALVLPLSGNLEKVGAAVRDGFLAAYYSDTGNSAADTSIKVFDSERYNSMTDLYLQLQIEDYDLIIGPLQKNRVEELAGFPQLSPPVLALNYADEQQEGVPGLFQYGLAAEDEIAQIVSHLQGQRKNRLALIYPATDWATDLITPLREKATNEKLHLLQFEYRPEDNLSRGIAALLDIEDSDQRFAEIRRLFGDVEFEPRRRQDIDAAILIANPTIARQIKPLLAFHYASQVPVYATSQIYAGFTQKDKDHDLDGVRFTETPWLLSKTIALKSDIQYLAGTNRYERLYAMGIDAYRLAPRLALMERFPASQLQGMTGNLNINGLNQIRRTLEWATFSNGQITTVLASDPR